MVLTYQEARFSNTFSPPTLLLSCLVLQLEDSVWDRDNILNPGKRVQESTKPQQWLKPWDPSTWLYVILLSVCIQEQKVPWSLLRAKMFLRPAADTIYG